MLPVSGCETSLRTPGAACVSATLENDSSGIDLSSISTSAEPAAGPVRKRPTGVKASLGYVAKPKRFTGLKVLAFVIAMGAGIMCFRMLAVPGGGPLMELYWWVAGLFGVSPS